MKPIDIGALVLIIVIWGSNFIVGKIVLAQVPPILMMAVRFTFVAAVLLPWLRPAGVPWPGMLALSVTLGGLHYCFLFVGLSGIDAGPAAIASQLFVPFSALLAWIFFRERMGPVQVAGIAVAFVGVYILGGEPRIAPDPLHFLLVVGGAFMLAVAMVQIKRLGAISVFTLNGWLAVLSAPQLYVVSLILEDGQAAALAGADWRAWGGIVFMAVAVTIGAHGLWYYLIRRYPVNLIVPPTLLAPVLAVFLGVAILGEPLGIQTMAGGAITILGVAAIQLRRPPAADATAGEGT